MPYFKTDSQRQFYRIAAARLSRLRKQQPMNRQLSIQYATDQIRKEWTNSLREIDALSERTLERKTENWLEFKCLVKGFTLVHHFENKRARHQ